MRHHVPQQTAGAAAAAADIRFTDPLLTGPARLARAVVEVLGGRFSAELGIDVDAGDAEVERWFLAATLCGTRISAEVAERAFAVLNEAGLTRIGQARHVPSEDLVELLDAGGYARYDFRTTFRLQALSEIIDERYEGEAAAGTGPTRHDPPWLCAGRRGRYAPGGSGWGAAAAAAAAQPRRDTRAGLGNRAGLPSG